MPHLRVRRSIERPFRGSFQSSGWLHNGGGWRAHYYREGNHAPLESLQLYGEAQPLEIKESTEVVDKDNMAVLPTRAGAERHRVHSFTS